MYAVWLFVKAVVVSIPVATPCPAAAERVLHKLYAAEYVPPAEAATTVTVIAPLKVANAYG